MGPRKASQSEMYQFVPTTDTGGWVEKTKVSGRTSLKEFGKLAGRTFAICPPLTQVGGTAKV